MAKDTPIGFRVPEKEANDYRDVADKIDISVSQIAREAMRKEIAKLKKTHPKLKEQTAAASQG